jgi:hypothetical protein
MTRLLVGLGLLVLAAPAMAQDAATATAQEAVLEPETGKDVLGPDAWSYRAITDEMDGTVTRIAAIQSANTVEFDFPYQGEQRATLGLIPKPGYDLVILSIEKGQMPCFDGCEVRVKFDDDDPQFMDATQGTSDDHDTLILDNMTYGGLFSSFVKRLQKAEVVKIEADVYGEGRTIFTFNVAGFDKDRYEGN